MIMGQSGPDLAKAAHDHETEPSGVGRGVAAPAPGAFELGGHGEQQGFAARRGHQLDRSRQAAGGRARHAGGREAAMFHTPVIGANLSAATTLRSQDRSPQRRAGGHGQANDRHDQDVMAVEERQQRRAQPVPVAVAGRAHAPDQLARTNLPTGTSFQAGAVQVRGGVADRAGEPGRDQRGRRPQRIGGIIGRHGMAQRGQQAGTLAHRRRERAVDDDAVARGAHGHGDAQRRWVGQGEGVPAITSSISAASATVVASGPFSSSPPQLSAPIWAGTTPGPGLRPNRPQTAAGMRTEPSPSVPCAIGTIADATAAADPPDDPPGVRCRSHGLRAIPNALSVNG